MWTLRYRDSDYDEARVFTFGSKCCAVAFKEGVEMVNDSALELLGLEEGIRSLCHRCKGTGGLWGEPEEKVSPNNPNKTSTHRSWLDCTECHGEGALPPLTNRKCICGNVFNPHYQGDPEDVRCQECIDEENAGVPCQGR